MKPYKMTKNVLAQIKKEFAAALEHYTTTDCKFNFSFTPKVESKEKFTVYCLPTAFCKMRTLVDKTDSEIAWHMCVEKLGKTTACITDVLVYPQTVTGATVNTDDTKYSLWVGDLPDEEFNLLRGQGHSHVNMGVSPSGVDTNYYSDLLTNVKSGVYLFMILNKKNEMFIQVVDIDKNIIYEKADINFEIGAKNWSENKWYKEQLEMVSKPVRTYTVSKKYAVEDDKTQYSLYEGDDWFDRFK